MVVFMLNRDASASQMNGNFHRHDLARKIFCKLRYFYDAFINKYVIKHNASHNEIFSPTKKRDVIFEIKMGVFTCLSEALQLLSG